MSLSTSPYQPALFGLIGPYRWHCPWNLSTVPTQILRGANRSESSEIYGFGVARPGALALLIFTTLSG